MYKSIFITLISVLGLAQIFSCKENEVQKPTSSLEFLIKDEFGGLLDSVQCEIASVDNKILRMTDILGRVKIEKIPVGNYTISYTKNGYHAGVKSIEVEANPTSIVLVLASGNTFLRVSESTLNFTHSSDSKTIHIESNSSWSITSNASWIKTSVLSSSGSSDIIIHWEKSNEDIERSAEVVFKAGSIERELHLIQSPPLKLIYSKGVIGNYENNIRDSIKITFNKPISVNSITTTYSFCLSEIQHKVSGKNLAFTYSCARLAESYPFTLSVKDGSETYTFNVDVNFYTEKTTVLANIIDYFVTEDNQAIWCITQNPSKLYKLSIPDLSIIKEHNLDYPLASIKWNKFKNTLNVFDYALYDEFNNGLNYLLYLEAETGEISKSEIKPIETETFRGDGYGTRFLVPKDISLFSNGTGIILLADQATSWGWRFIDSRNSDSTYLSESHYNYSEIGYQEIHINYDKTKMYMMYPSGTTTIDIYEMGNQTFKTFTSPLPGRSSVLIANKKRDRVYVGQLYEQFITDLNGYMSKISIIDTRAFYGGTDFSYKDDEDETIYNLADGNFRILDYKIGFTSFSADANGRLSKISSTTDGENLIALKHNSEGTTDFFLFNIDEMTTNRAPNPNSGTRVETSLGSLKSVWIK